MDAFAGAIGCSDSRGKITPVVHVCKTTGNNRFFMYALRSMAANDVLMSFAEGIRVRSSDFRNFNKLGKFPIVVPPINEQNEIVAFLDRKCREVVTIVLQKQQQLDVLVEYKKSLIFEYVSGKKEVTIT
jgi:type I restriction enzyme S subunit